MRLARPLFVASTLLAALAAPAVAATVIAPSLSPFGAQVWYCVVENVGKKPIDATVTQYDTAGIQVNQFTGTYNPFQPSSVSDAGTVGGSCRVDWNGSKKAVRVFVCIFDNTAGCVHIMPGQ